jgi:RHS repeat-associated protein
MSNKSGTSDQVISLPKGGGALHGIGETFSPDLHTGTGNFTVPIALPPGRNGFQPQLNLVYSTGNPNGYFGLGWSLSIPGVSRKTSQGVPRYQNGASQVDERDTFILSGAEDLVVIQDTQEETHYRPRTEGLFAQIVHHHDPKTQDNYWEVRSKDGLVSLYGTPGLADNDLAVAANPSNPAQVFVWKLTETCDPFDNRIHYRYARDRGKRDGHAWDQPYLQQMCYVDYTKQGQLQFLVWVTFEYEDRKDEFSDYRAGFEMRTTRRCKAIHVETHTDHVLKVRTYSFAYQDDPCNGVSLLQKMEVIGYDDQNKPVKELPPLTFGYTQFEPQKQKFFAIAGSDLPPASLAHPDYELADLTGDSLPDIFEMNGTVRYWRNLGNGTFDLPRPMRDAPAGLALADVGVQLIDADGDGRIDLLASKDGLFGYFPLRFEAVWDRGSFRRYETAPSFNLEDPEVKLVDLNGDGIIDVIRSGTRLECFFNDREKGWNGRTRWLERRALENFPNVNFSDPRVKWGDMTGDGLQDIVLVYDGTIEYWPNLGHGNWCKRIHMRNSPRFPYGYDPKRILIGDVDGDGAADLVYVDDTKVTLWINESGNGWSNPITIVGTPPVTDMDAVRLVDMLGSGISGVLWSSDASMNSRKHMFFLDFTGGIKPYLLHEMDNHLGAVTKVEYAPSTRFYVKDRVNPKTRWKTSLPFPVQVVARVEVIDDISRGKLTTEYAYHHGYWDGAEREFRGFGMVEQFDTETFELYKERGLHGEAVDFSPVEQARFSPPTCTKTWFHQGPVGEEFGEWQELDLSGEYWSGDPQVLKHTETINNFLKGLQRRRVKRDALRTLRGSILRTELYALDSSIREDRPYTVTEYLYGLREESPPAADNEDRPHIFFSHTLAQRTTQWERGDEPMTQFTFTGDYDTYGQPRSQIGIAVPRGRDYRVVVVPDAPHEPYLATHSVTTYAQRDDAERYIVDRVASTTTFKIKNDGKPSLSTLQQKIQEEAVDGLIVQDRSIIGQTLNFYDRDDSRPDKGVFLGLPYGQIGDYGALVRTQSLVLTEAILQAAYGSDQPPYLMRSGGVVWSSDYPQGFQTALPSLAGYTYQSGGAGSVHTAGYFITTERRRYDFHDDPNGKGRGLVKVKRDPLGRDTTITYDVPYNLLPTEVTAPIIALKTKAAYNYRILQPSAITDPNGNRNRFTFTPLGLLKDTWLLGKTISEGDQQRPSVTMEYDFLAFANRGQPIFVRTIRQVHHDKEMDVPLPQQDETIETREYSDGFGRLLQTRTQGEEVRFGDPVFGGGVAVLPVKQSDGAGKDVVGTNNANAAKPNVVVSGWQIFDNKGRVVEKYEPFFSEGWGYAPPTAAQYGQKATMFYDPRGQVICTLNPDGSEQRVIYGVPGKIVQPDLEKVESDAFDPTPWEAYTYDANDNAGRTHAGTAIDYRHHWNTPKSIVIDALGRTVATVERNRAKPVHPADPLPPIEEYRTSSTYDIRGNLLTLTEALGRVAFKHVYDLANRPLRIESIDAGTKRTVVDAAGNIIEGRDSRGALVLHAYDTLNRPTRLWARDDTNQPLTVRERLVYGDDPNSGLTPAQVAAGNLLGKLYQHYDEAGLLIFVTYDFKGNLLEKQRQVIADTAILAVFNQPPSNWKIHAFRVDWEMPSATSLDTTAYTTTLAYDALNRVKMMLYPKDVEGTRKILRPYYNRAGALERVELTGTTYVEHIAYNAKGQRTLIAYGNGVMTRYAYEEQTFRLVRMRTEHHEVPAGSKYVFHPSDPGKPLQDFAYEYDLVGNILKITDRTPGCGVVNTPAGKDGLNRLFTYDPLYRLISATGRECLTIPKPRPWEDWRDAQNCGYYDGKPGTPNQDNAPDLTTMYWETYVYDPAGNMVTLQHGKGVGPDWTRHFGMGGLLPQQWGQEWPTHLNATGTWSNPPGNCLTHVGDNQPGVMQNHFYDENGNLVKENTERHFEWNHSDRICVFRTQTGSAEPSKHAHYFYDATGQRVKKLLRKQGGQVEVTIYIDEVFEFHRLVKPSKTRENNTLHIMDNQSRFALVRVGDAFPDDVAPQVKVKYHLGDHLGSSSVVVDENGSWINREEYFPYGETSFGSFARKRYRYTGKQRDEESGLYYHGRRYYAPYLARFLSCDPLGPVDTLNLYIIDQANPISRIDPTGLASGDAGVLLESDVNGTPSNTTTASPGSGSIQGQEGGGYTWASGPAPDATDAGVLPRSQSGNYPLHGIVTTPEWKLSASAKTTAGDTTKTDAQSTTRDMSIKTKYSATLLEWSAVSESGNISENSSETSGWLTIATTAWTKEKFGSYNASLLKMGLSTSGPSLSLADLGATAYSKEQGWLFGTRGGGLTADWEMKELSVVGSLGMKDGKVTAEAGATVASLRVSGGVNILERNLSVFLEANAGEKYGFELGSETSAHVGILGAGITLGEAKGHPHPPPYSLPGMENFFPSTPWEMIYNPLNILSR